MTQAMQHLKQFVDNVQETARSLERIQQEIIPTHSRPEQGMFFYLIFLCRMVRYLLDSYKACRKHFYDRSSSSLHQDASLFSLIIHKAVEGLGTL